MLNIMRELSHIQAGMHADGCDCTTYFHFKRGGTQGGIDTLDLSSCAFEYILVPVQLVENWELGDFGFERTC